MRVSSRIWARSGWLAAILVLVAMPTQSAERPGTGLRFHQYTIENGLNQNSVYAVLQDQRGFMWIGTEDGLHRFDGNEMHLYEAIPGNPAGLASDFILDLANAPGGGIWVAAYGGGLALHDTDTDRFRHFRHDPDDADSLSSDNMVYIDSAPDGSVWAMDDHTLNHLNPSSGKVVRHAPGESGLPDAALLTLAVDAQGNVWIGTETGLYWRRADDEVFKAFTSAQHPDDLFRGWISTLAEAANGDVFVGIGEERLLHLNASQQLVDVMEPADVGLSDTDFWPVNVLLTSTGELWVSMSEQGVFWRDRMTGEFINYRHDPADPWSISDDVVMAMHEDRGGILWFGTLTGGINKFNPATRAFRHYRAYRNEENSLPNRLVWSVIEDRNGDLWVGTESGVSFLDRGKGRYTHYRYDSDSTDGIISPYVYRVIEGPDGDIWIGTANGLSVLDRDTGTFRNFGFPEDQVDDAYYANSISDIHHDEYGNTWLATAEGLVEFSFDAEEYPRWHYDADNPDSELSAPGNELLSLTSSRLTPGFWVVGNKGFALFDPETRTFSRHHYPGERLPEFQSVQAMLEDDDGTLWIGTEYRLLQLLPNGKVRAIGVDDGLPSNNIYEILQDGEGDLWLATNRGLAEYSPDDGQVRTFDVSDGLQSYEFNSNAGFRSSTGEMFFGGINGFNAFYPSRVVQRDVKPTVAITGFSLFNKPAELEKPLHSLESISLDWRDTVFGFDFAVLDFAAPGKNRYRYMLEGFDEQWLETRDHSHVTYTNLDAGNYRLRVRGANNAGQWSEAEAQLQITVAPPPWKTWWAYLLYIMAALTLVSIAVRMHLVRVADRHKLENEQQKRQWAETLHQLTSALSSSLDSSQVAEELLESLRSMLTFRKAVLFVEQGVDIHVAGVKGILSGQERDALESLPTSHSRFFAEIRHARKPRLFTLKEQGMDVLQEGMSEQAHFLAVPAYSRSDEFALVIIGRDAPPFSGQEQDIVSAFLTQSLVALDNARLFAELQNTSTTDPLTQVNNRRYFFELAELEFNRSRRYERDVSIILIDADKFHDINETYGRDIGDRALKLIASVCRNNVRHFDIIGRYGGEDFIIMLPETPVNVAADVADRLRKAIEDIRIDTYKGELQVTVSVGVTVVTEDIKDLPALINRADMALYEAKRTGRNRVIVAEH